MITRNFVDGETHIEIDGTVYTRVTFKDTWVEDANGDSLAILTRWGWEVDHNATSDARELGLLPKEYTPPTILR